MKKTILFFFSVALAAACIQEKKRVELSPGTLVVFAMDSTAFTATGYAARDPRIFGVVVELVDSLGKYRASIGDSGRVLFSGLPVGRYSGKIWSTGFYAKRFEYFADDKASETAIRRELAPRQ